MTGKYDDIIYLPHHVSGKRPAMPISDRAAQFSPFAALTGYDEAVMETGRLTDRMHELSEEDTAKLNRQLQFLMTKLREQPTLSVTYFVPDEKKSGGAYIVKKGKLRKC